MKQITMDWDTYQDEMKKERQEGLSRGYADTFNDLRIIQELIEGDDPYQALQHINDIFEGEHRELLIKIFRLEEIDKDENS